MTRSTSCTVGIVGATGAAGQELLHLLHGRHFPFSSLRLFASGRSAGKTVQVDGQVYRIEEAKPSVFAELDIAFFAAGGTVSRALAPEAVKAGCLVIDKSSAFRADSAVPLVIPEINPEALKIHRGIVANPNCSTAVALMALWPLHQRFGLKRYFAATYQSVSGSGVKGVHELEGQIRAHVSKTPVPPLSAYAYPIAFNVIPQVDSFGPNGYTGEETKMEQESRKIMGLPKLRVSATCVRVPVVRAHSVAINAEFERPVSVAEAKAAIAGFSGAQLLDEPSKQQYPTPLDFSQKVKCGVGRIRVDTALDNGLALWVSGDNLWKGAALNAVQNAELMISERLLTPKDTLVST